MFVVSNIVIPVCIGVVVGVLSGLLGIGGGTIMVPVFRLLFGLSPVSATATSLFAIIPTSISGAVTHLRNKTCILKLGIAAGIGGACTSPIGVWLASMAPGWMVMAAVALVISFSSYKMFRKAIQLPAGGAKEPIAAAAPSAAAAAAPSAAATAAPDATATSGAAAASEPIGLPELTREQLFKGFFIGLLAGLIAGFVGVGGGFLMVPLFISVLGLSMKQISGTSLIAVLILAIPGTIANAMMGNIDFLAGIAMVCGTIPGAVLGAKLIKFVPERALRFLFGGFLLVVAAVLVAREFGILG